MYYPSFRNQSGQTNPWGTSSINPNMRPMQRNLSTRAATSVSPIPLATSMASTAKTGLLPSLKSFSWGGLLSGAQKTISAVNQIVPLYHQVQPLISNAKTLLKVSKVMKTIDSKNPEKEIKTTDLSSEKSLQNENKLEVAQVDSTSPGKPFFV